MSAGTVSNVVDRQRRAKLVIGLLGKHPEKAREKDRQFITSLAEQKNPFSEKQLSYIVGDENGQTPKDFPALAKRYEKEVEELISAGVTVEGVNMAGLGISRKLTPEVKAQIDKMMIIELEDALDEQWKACGENMSKFESDPVTKYMRERYLAETDPNAE